MIKVVYFDDSSATDYLYIYDGGQTIQTTEKVKDKSKELANKTSAGLFAKLSWLPFLGGQASTEIDMGFSYKGSSLLTTTLSNTVLTDFLSRVAEDSERIAKFTGYSVKAYKNSIAFFKMFTPYLSMTTSDFTSEGVSFDLSRMDEAFESGKGYYEMIATKGIYAEMFEECYNELFALPKYAALKERFQTDVAAAHDGYFSQDKKGNYKDTKGDTIADYDTYNTIMKDKEWLLSFDCPLRFIFSHSALKEGWDNPNVFQVCTLIEQKSTFTCRQKVGRGLRLCVNQDGGRIEDKDINVLHVMANESFAEFADTLQKEIEQETGVKFGYMDISLFSGMVYEEKITQEKNVDEADAAALISFMKNYGYIENDGKPTELAKAAVIERTAELPPQMEEIKERVAQVIENDMAVTPDTLIGTPYVETITVEKTVSYEDAAELIAHFEDKGYVGKGGRIKDTMKNALLNGKLDYRKSMKRRGRSLRL